MRVTRLVLLLYLFLYRLIIYLVIASTSLSPSCLRTSRQVKSASRSPPSSPSPLPLLPRPHLRSPFAHPRLTSSSPSPGEPLMARRSSLARHMHLLDPASSLHPPWSRRRMCNHGPKRAQIWRLHCAALSNRRSLLSLPSSLSLSASVSLSICLSLHLSLSPSVSLSPSPPLAQSTAVKISVCSSTNPSTRLDLYLTLPSPPRDGSTSNRGRAARRSRSERLQERGSRRTRSSQTSRETREKDEAGSGCNASSLRSVCRTPSLSLCLTIQSGLNPDTP